MTRYYHCFDHHEPSGRLVRVMNRYVGNLPPMPAYSGSSYASGPV